MIAYYTAYLAAPYLFSRQSRNMHVKVKGRVSRKMKILSASTAIDTGQVFLSVQHTGNYQLCRSFLLKNRSQCILVFKVPRRANDDNKIHTARAEDPALQKPNNPIQSDLLYIYTVICQKWSLIATHHAHVLHVLLGKNLKEWSYIQTLLVLCLHCYVTHMSLTHKLKEFGVLPSCCSFVSYLRFFFFFLNAWRICFVMCLAWWCLSIQVSRQVLAEQIMDILGLNIH